MSEYKFPYTCGLSARTPIQQNIVSSHKVQADPLHRVNKGGSYYPALDQVKMDQTTDQGGIKHRQVAPLASIKKTQFAKWMGGFHHGNISVQK